LHGNLIEGPEHRSRKESERCSSAFWFEVNTHSCAVYDVTWLTMSVMVKYNLYMNICHPQSWCCESEHRHWHYKLFL